jgi:hypothetical protein
VPCFSSFTQKFISHDNFFEKTNRGSFLYYHRTDPSFYGGIGVTAEKEPETPASSTKTRIITDAENICDNPRLLFRTIF